MRGKVFKAPGRRLGGLILGADGKRYRFVMAEWRHMSRPLRGMPVEFVPSGSVARELAPVPDLVWRRAGTADGEAQGGGRSVLGMVAIACLALGLVVPLLPTIIAVMLGSIGSKRAELADDMLELALARAALIGGLLMLLAGVVLLIVTPEAVRDYYLRLFWLMTGTPGTLHAT